MAWKLHDSTRLCESWQAGPHFTEAATSTGLGRTTVEPKNSKTQTFEQKIIVYGDVKHLTRSCRALSGQQMYSHLK